MGEGCWECCYRIRYPGGLFLLIIWVMFNLSSDIIFLLQNYILNSRKKITKDKCDNREQLKKKNSITRRELVIVRTWRWGGMKWLFYKYSTVHRANSSIFLEDYRLSPKCMKFGALSDSRQRIASISVSFLASLEAVIKELCQKIQEWT